MTCTFSGITKILRDMVKSGRRIGPWFLSLLFLQGGVSFGGIGRYEEPIAFSERSSAAVVTETDDGPQWITLEEEIKAVPAISKPVSTPGTMGSKFQTAQKQGNSQKSFQSTTPIQIELTPEVIAKMNPKTLVEVDVSNLDKIPNLYNLYKALGVNKEDIPSIFTMAELAHIPPYGLIGRDCRALDPNYKMTLRLVSLSDEPASQKQLEMYAACFICRLSSNKEARQKLINGLRLTGAPFIERQDQIVIADPISIKRLQDYKDFSDKLAKKGMFDLEKVTDEVPSIHVMAGDCAEIFERLLALGEEGLPILPELPPEFKKCIDELRSVFFNLNISFEENCIKIVAPLKPTNIGSWNWEEWSKGLSMPIKVFYPKGGIAPQDYWAFRSGKRSYALLSDEKAFKAAYSGFSEALKRFAYASQKTPVSPKEIDKEMEALGAVISRFIELVPESIFVSSTRESFMMGIMDFPKVKTLGELVKKVMKLKKQAELLDKLATATDEEPKAENDKEGAVSENEEEQAIDSLSEGYLTSIAFDFQEDYRGWKIYCLKDEPRRNFFGTSSPINQELFPQYYVTLKDERLIGSVKLEDIKRQIDGYEKVGALPVANFLKEGEIRRDHMRIVGILELLKALHHLTDQDLKAIDIDNQLAALDMVYKFDQKKKELVFEATIDYELLEAIRKGIPIVKAKKEAEKIARRKAAMATPNLENPHGLVPVKKSPETPNFSVNEWAKNSVDEEKNIAEASVLDREKFSNTGENEARFARTAHFYPKSYSLSNRQILIPVKTSAEYRVIS